MYLPQEADLQLLQVLMEDAEALLQGRIPNEAELSQQAQPAAAEANPSPMTVISGVGGTPTTACQLDTVRNCDMPDSSNADCVSSPQSLALLMMQQAYCTVRLWRQNASRTLPRSQYTTPT